jgi:hypothetical protein
VAASRAKAWTAVLLAWILPGLGHFSLGRRRRALLYAAIVTVTFLAGLSFQGRLDSPEPGAPLTYLATFASLGSGLLNIVARLVLENPRGMVLSVTYEYGCTFLRTAGLMNLLLMLDTYDIAAGRKG